MNPSREIKMHFNMTLHLLRAGGIRKDNNELMLRRNFSCMKHRKMIFLSDKVSIWLCKATKTSFFHSLFAKYTSALHKTAAKIDDDKTLTRKDDYNGRRSYVSQELHLYLYVAPTGHKHGAHVFADCF